MTDNQLKSSLRFVKNLAKVFSPSHHGAHVGLVVYGEKPETIFSLTDNTSVTNVIHMVDNVKPSKQKKRKVGKALRYVNDALKEVGRTGVPKILIVLQSKRSWDDIDEISQEIRHDGLKVFGIGNGNRMAEGQLKEISSKPTSYYYKTASYHVIETSLFVQQMKESICMGMSFVVVSDRINDFL